MTRAAPSELRFQGGGTLRQGAYYVERDADRELPEALLAGELCYVLAPRQIGKSSLRVRTAHKLTAQGLRCISIDLNMAGTQDISAESWYYSLAQEISQQLDLPTDAWDFWQRYKNTTPTYRFSFLLRDALLHHIKERVVLFIDEIDSVLALPFPTDDFFAAIRAVYNDRAENEQLQRLTFCLLGVAAPADLIQNPVLTPFNIGRAIILEDLTRAEAQALLPGLQRAAGDPQRLLSAVLAWTDGHPYMTQRLCEALIKSEDTGSEEERVERQVAQGFLASGRNRDPNLAYAEKRLEKNSLLPSILRIYSRLLDGLRVDYERDDPVQTEMQLAGLVARRTVEGRPVLHIRNRIFAFAFDPRWLQTQDARRRIDEPLQRWLGSGKRPDFLLHGEALSQMLAWAGGRLDLDETEFEFLLAGLEAEHSAEQHRREVAESQRRIEEDKRKYAEAQRQTEEDRRKAMEARRQAEQEQQQALEEQRRAERAQKQAEYEKERARAQVRARRQIILVLLAALVILFFSAGVLLVQTFEVRRASRAAQDKQNETERVKEAAIEAARDKQGIVAALQAPQPGRQVEALAAALESVWPRLAAGKLPTSQAAEGLSMAAGVGVYAFRLPTHTTDWVRSAAFSPDGKYLATAGNDGNVNLWDGMTYASLGTLRAHEGEIRSVVYSHHGSRLLTASGDGTAKVFGATDHALLLTLRGHERGLRVATFSPDDEIIITASDDGTARVWDGKSGKLLHTLQQRPVDRYAAFSPDGEFLATAGEDPRHPTEDANRAWLWDTRSFKPRYSLDGHGGPLRAIAYSPDGRYIATSGLDSTARIWDSRTHKQLAILSGHAEPVRALAFSPDSRYVATASDDKTATIWEVPSGLPLLTLLGHTESIRSVTYSPDGTRVVTASIDRSVRIWYVATGRTLVALSGHRQWVSSANYSPDGKHIVTASEDKTVRIWNAETGAEETSKRIIGHKGDVRSAVYSRDGTRIVTASNDCTARIWDAETGQQQQLLLGHTGYVQLAVFSPDQSRVVTASSDSTAMVWDATTGKHLQTLLGHSKMVRGVSISPDGRHIVTTGVDRTVRTWDGETGTLLNTLSGLPDEVFSVRHSPDGKRLVTACRDNAAYVWDVDARTGDPPLMKLSGHSGGVWSAEYSPDGRLILTASNDQTARIWDAYTGALRMTLAGHAGGLTYASFSPLFSAGNSESNLRVVTAGRDHIAVIHPVRIEDYFRIACNLWWPNREDLPEPERNKTRTDNLARICAPELGKWPPPLPQKKPDGEAARSGAPVTSPSPIPK